MTDLDYGDPALPQRFWDKVYPCPITGCWFWGGAVHDGYPYGMWRVQGKALRAHVSSFRAAGGVLAEDRPHVLHSCDQPPCVRPEHLRAGSPAENTDDARRRGRLAVGTNSALSPDQVVELRSRYAAGERTPALAGEYGISSASISLIVRGLHWASAGGPLTTSRPIPGRPSPALDRTHCKYGHQYTPDNVWMKPNPSCRSGFERVCRTCRKRINQEQAARRKALRHAEKLGKAS